MNIRPGSFHGDNFDKPEIPDKSLRTYPNGINKQTQKRILKEIIEHTGITCDDHVFYPLCGDDTSLESIFNKVTHLDIDSRHAHHFKNFVQEDLSKFSPNQKFDTVYFRGFNSEGKFGQEIVLPFLKKDGYIVDAGHWISRHPKSLLFHDKLRFVASYLDTKRTEDEHKVRAKTHQDSNYFGGYNMIVYQKR